LVFINCAGTLNYFFILQQELSRRASKPVNKLHPTTGLICSIFAIDLEVSRIIQNIFQLFNERLGIYQEANDKWMLDLVDTVASCKESAQVKI
jgi:hypothetical protein